MKKNLNILVCVGLLSIIYSCKTRVTKNLVPINEESFLSLKKPISDDSIINQVSLNMNRSLKLEKIENSSQVNEIRLYFVGPFRERLFIEKQSKDLTDVSLYNCKTIKKADSLFLKIGDLIKLKYSSNLRKEFNIESIPEILKYERDTISTVADGGHSYFYEIKIGSKFKRGIIDMPFDREKPTKESKAISSLVEKINDKYNFKFNDTWDNITTSFYPR